MVAYNDAGVSPRTLTYVESKMLKHAQVTRVLQHTALQKTMPKNKTQTITFRRPNIFAAQTSPLVEGVTPSPTAFTYTDVPATLRQYGQVVEFTDVIEDTHEDPVVQDISKQSGENIGRTIEALDWAVVRGGTAVIYTNGSARTDVNTPLSLTKIRSAVRTLKRQKAMLFRDAVKPGPNYATRGIEPSWIAVGHTDLDSDIRNLPGFIPTVAYGSRNQICDEEIGSVENIRFLLSADLDVLEDAGAAFAGSGSSMVTTAGTSADIYPLVIFGRESWASIGLGMDSESIVPSVFPAKATKEDPLGQRGTVGWKTWHAAVRLNEAWMVRIEAAVSAL